MEQNKNKELLAKYPYAFAHNAWTGELCVDENGQPWTEECCLPVGWYKLFWLCMEDLREPLQKAGLFDTFYFIQIKEKYGTMRLYNNGCNQEIMDIIDKYEYISQFVCEMCGKPAIFQTVSWVGSYCKDCINKKNDDYELLKRKLTYTLTTHCPDGKVKKRKMDCTNIWNRLFGEEKYAEKM